MNDRYRDRIELRGMRFSARHGVHPEEKERPQPFEVDLVLFADLRPGATTDDLAATVDYGSLFDLVGRVVNGPSFNLIEALAGAIARAVLEATDPGVVERVEVRVRKPEAPLPGPFETVEAAVVRSRP
jgi:7,8-dihydroneopterin aldolase/epimerase/oxygenase